MMRCSLIKRSKKQIQLMQIHIYLSMNVIMWTWIQDMPLSLTLASVGLAVVHWPTPWPVWARATPRLPTAPLSIWHPNCSSPTRNSDTEKPNTCSDVYELGGTLVELFSSQRLYGEDCRDLDTFFEMKIDATASPPAMGHAPWPYQDILRLDKLPTVGWTNDASIRELDSHLLIDLSNSGLEGKAQRQRVCEDCWLEIYGWLLIFLSSVCSSFAVSLFLLAQIWSIRKYGTWVSRWHSNGFGRRMRRCLMSFSPGINFHTTDIQFRIWWKTPRVEIRQNGAPMGPWLTKNREFWRFSYFRQRIWLISVRSKHCKLNILRELFHTYLRNSWVLNLVYQSVEWWIEWLSRSSSILSTMHDPEVVARSKEFEDTSEVCNQVA